MRRTALRALECAILLLTIAAYCRPAHAYVDMGTGSYIIQVSIAAVEGALFSLKIFWSGIRQKLRSLTGSRDTSATSSKVQATPVSSTSVDGK